MSRTDTVPADFAPRTARAITGVVIVGFFLVALSYAIGNHLGLLGFAFFLVTLSILLGLQLNHSFPTMVPRLARHRRATLAVQAVLTYVPFLCFGNAWLGMPGFLGASSLLVLQGAAGWIGFGLVLVTSAPIQFLVGYHLSDLAYELIAVTLTSFIVAGLSRMADLVIELHEARAELARTAITQERLRFARDLHDLLGYSISTITLKCEYAYRLVPVQPERAQAELTEILQVSRQALSDVRALADSYRSMSVRSEAVAVQQMLSSVGLEAEFTVPESLELRQDVDTVFATVLREGVTNVLRHSKAQKCTMSVECTDGVARLVLWNDGAGKRARDTHEPRSGSGILNLTHRLEALGGTLTVNCEGKDGFALEAVVRL